MIREKKERKERKKKKKKRKATDLATPAHPNSTPIFDRPITLVREFFNHLGDPRQVLVRRSLGSEELAELFPLLLGIWWIPGGVGRLAFEKVGHEDLILVLLVIGMREDVGALASLLVGLLMRNEDFLAGGRANRRPTWRI